MERRKYYKHKWKAIGNSSKYLSLIIDGMDQSKTFLPHLLEHTKATSSMWNPCNWSFSSWPDDIWIFLFRAIRTCLQSYKDYFA